MLVLLASAVFAYRRWRQSTREFIAVRTKEMFDDDAEAAPLAPSETRVAEETGLASSRSAVGPRERRLTVMAEKGAAIGSTSDVPSAHDALVKLRPSRSFAEQKRQMSLLEKALTGNPLFAEIGLLQLDTLVKIASVMERVRVKPGETVIATGEVGKHFYVVLSGDFEALLEEQIGVMSTARTVATYQEGDCFGELALLYNTRRAATVRRCTDDEDDGEVWALDRDHFRSLLKGRGDKIAMAAAMLASHRIFAVLSDTQRWHLARATRTVRYAAGEIICEQGDAATCM